MKVVLSLEQNSIAIKDFTIRTRTWILDTEIRLKDVCATLKMAFRLDN